MTKAAKTSRRTSNGNESNEEDSETQQGTGATHEENHSTCQSLGKNVHKSHSSPRCQKRQNTEVQRKPYEIRESQITNRKGRSGCGSFDETDCYKKTSGNNTAEKKRGKVRCWRENHAERARRMAVSDVCQALSQRAAAMRIPTQEITLIDVP